jgi:hypothetical protein
MIANAVYMKLSTLFRAKITTSIIQGKMEAFLRHMPFFSTNLYETLTN